MSNTRELNQKNYDNFSLEHSKLDIDATMYLAYRDLPLILNTHLFNKNIMNKYRILDYGCGAGTSTKIFCDLFKKLNIEIEMYGVDINEENLKLAEKRNPDAKFMLINKDDFLNDMEDRFDLVLCYLVLLENSYDDMVNILVRINKVLSENGVAIIVNCTAKAYDQSKEWYSGNMRYPENKPTIYDFDKKKLKLQDGQRVKTTMYDRNTGTSFTFFDYFHRRRTYKAAYYQAELMLLATHKPLGTNLDGRSWKSEMDTPIYRIDVVCKNRQELVNTQEQKRVFSAKL